MALIAQPVLNVGAELGEGPVWDAARGLLWFVDIKRRLVHRYDPESGGHYSFTAPAQVGWVLPTTGPDMLAGLQDGLYRMDPDSGVFRFWQAIPGEPEGNRLNDACTDPMGRVWFGSMDDSEAQPCGRFYCLEDGVIRPAGPDGICITNGPGVSADGRRIIFTDTLGKTMWEAPLDAGGTGEPRLFASISERNVWPDGPSFDSAGRVWTGLWGGGRVACFAPDGSLVQEVAVAAHNCTKVAFGGPDLRTAYVTTARKGLDQTTLDGQPHAGDLFAFPMDIAGAPVPPARID